MAANECIPLFEPGGHITGDASAAVTGKRFVKISGNAESAPDALASNADGGNIRVAHADAGGRAFGVAAHDAATNGKVTIIRGPGFVVPVYAAAAIAAFEEVKVGANGKATPASGAVAASVEIGTGNSKIKFTANEAGAAGNDLSVTIVDPAGNNASLSIDVDGDDITVNLATDGASNPTSTVAQVIAAVLEHDTASQLVTASNGTGSDGTGVMAAASETPLTGGADAVGDAGGDVVGFAVTAASQDTDAFIALY